MNNEQLPAARFLARALREDGQGTSPKWMGHAADMLEAQYDYIESLSAVTAAGGVEAFRALIAEAARKPYQQHLAELNSAAQAEAMAWAVVHNADMVLTQSAVIAEAWRKAGLDVISLAPVVAVVAVPDVEVALLMNRSACRKYPDDINMRLAHNAGWRAATAQVDAARAAQGGAA